MEAHIKEHPAWFHRFEVSWTPTVLIFDSEGKERFRIEGYLPNDEFRAQLELGLARLAFVKKQWADAEKRYAEIVQRYPQSAAAPEAQYWKGVSQYQASHNPKVLAETARQFQNKYQNTEWAKRSLPWQAEG